MNSAMIEFLTALLVIITGFYAWATYRILKANELVVEAMREQSEATYRPYVAVSLFLEPDNPIFYMRVKNLGKTAAKDVRLKIDRPFFKFGRKSDEDNLESFAVFNEPIDSLPPDSEIIFSLIQANVLFKPNTDQSICPRSFIIHSCYKFGSKEVNESHLIDMKPYMGSDIPQDPMIRKMKEISENIRGIRNAMK